MEFQGFPKIARLNRNIVITEKIDGTNGCIIVSKPDSLEEFKAELETATAEVGDYLIHTQSRKRLLQPNAVAGKGSDNFGFAAWVAEHCEDLVELGEGRHFGEWWGGGIQRGYGLAGGAEPERRFSLFNTARWSDGGAKAHGPRPACCDVVPILRQWGRFDSGVIQSVLDDLAEVGSYAAPGYPDPEGIVVYHTHSNSLFKATIEADDKPKGASGVAGNVVINHHDPMALPPLAPRPGAGAAAQAVPA